MTTIQKTDFILGADKKGNYINAEGYQHVLLVAKTGAGKGVSTFLPNLLTIQDSMFVHDIKGENFELTSGWRASQGQKIFVFNPLNKDKKTHRFNPFDFVSNDVDARINDIQKIANILIPCKQCADARGLFIATSLCLFSSKTPTFGEIVRFLANNPTEVLSNEVSSFAKIFVSKTEKERSKIVAKLYSCLEIFSNPLVDNATSGSDFDVSKFKIEKSTVYVVLQPSEVEFLKPLMSFFYQYSITALSNCDTNHGVIFAFDEFTTIGKMPSVIDAIAYCRGFKIRLFIAVQNIEQIEGVYGEYGTKAIIYNSAFKICFGTESKKTAEFFSNLSISSKEIIELEKEEEVLLIENKQPIFAKKLKYFEGEFKDRILDAVLI